ncbi:MAG: hypothetical protein ACPG44_02700 [Polaribacter sp.]
MDTNIIFSGLLSQNGTISDLLLDSSEVFDFYSPTFVLEELKNHKTDSPFKLVVKTSLNRLKKGRKAL